MVFKLLSYRDEIVQRFNAQLRPILRPILWLYNRNRNQQAGSIPMFDLIGDWKAAAPMNRTANDAECAWPAPQSDTSS